MFNALNILLVELVFLLVQMTLLTGEQSTMASISSRFSTMIVLFSVADLEIMDLDSGEPKPIEASKPTFSSVESVPNGFGVSLKIVSMCFRFICTGSELSVKKE